MLFRSFGTRDGARCARWECSFRFLGAHGRYSFLVVVLVPISRNSRFLELQVAWVIADTVNPPQNAPPARNEHNRERQRALTVNPEQRDEHPHDPDL